MVPLPATRVEEANRLWEHYKQRDDSWHMSNSSGSGSYHGSISIVGSGQVPQAAGWPTSIQFPGGVPTPYQVGQGVPSLAASVVVGATSLGTLLETTYGYYNSTTAAGGSYVSTNSSEGVDCVLSSVADNGAAYNVVKSAVLAHSYPLDWTVPPFVIAWHDCPFELGHAPTDFDGSQYDGGGFPFGIELAPRPMQWFSASEAINYASSGWAIGDGLINLFRGQALLLDTIRTYYFIGRFQSWYPVFTNPAYPSRHWVSRVSFVSDGYVTPVGGQAILECPFPTSSPFPIAGIQTVGIASDLNFLVIGQDPVGWFRQWAVTIGGPQFVGQTQPSGFGDFYGS